MRTPATGYGVRASSLDACRSFALAMASYAWKRFRASLRDPLTPSTADKSEMWLQTCGFWMMAGVVMAILSIPCIVLWQVL